MALRQIDGESGLGLTFDDVLLVPGASDVMPGEVLSIELVREGSEPGQGVGYRSDGSMVVVSDAAEQLGNEVRVRVSHSVPTAKGIMHFATIDAHEDLETAAAT